ncbi:hypothetical protein ACFQ64_19460 [Streptomyces sp. NPDC056460]|uniref:hypothetical protein n=1 Tax=Streptomyces sp. NPDC056460 TaxID=3345825 RepID=UPI00367FFFF1
MSLLTLPVHRGLRVPHVARWTGEEDISPAVIVGAGGILRYAEPIADAACRWQGALWRRLARAQGTGEPVFEALHPVRQRTAMWEQQCQVCGQSVAAEATAKGGALYLGGTDAASGTQDPMTEGERTENPPLHLACAWESVSHCRHLLEGYTAARVARPRQWGVAGVLHAPARGTVVPVQRTEVPYGSAQLGWMLAERAIVKLTGVRAVDLACEAEQAGLGAAGSRR